MPPLAPPAVPMQCVCTVQYRTRFPIMPLFAPSPPRMPPHPIVVAEMRHASHTGLPGVVLSSLDGQADLFVHLARGQRDKGAGLLMRRKLYLVTSLSSRSYLRGEKESRQLSGRARRHDV